MIGSIQQARFVVTNANNPEVRGLELLRYYVNHRKPLQCIGWQWNVLVLPLLITRINRRNHRFVPWLMFVKINFVWMRIIRVPRETDFACYLIKPRRNCFQVNSAFNFGVCEHIAPCFNFCKVKCETWILTSILKSSQLMNIIGTIVNLTYNISYCDNIKTLLITVVLVLHMMMRTGFKMVQRRHKRSIYQE